MENEEEQNNLINKEPKDITNAYFSGQYENIKNIISEFFNNEPKVNPILKMELDKLLEW